MKIYEYIKSVKSLDLKKFPKQTRVAFLSSFTINGIPEIVSIKCSQSNIGCTTFQANYNQYMQEVLNPSSSIYKFKADITFLLLDTRKIIGDLFFFPYSKSVIEKKKIIKEATENIFSILEQFCKNSESKLIISSLSIPTYSPYGIFENKVEYSMKEMIEDFNLQLNCFIRNKPSLFLFDMNSFIQKHGELNVFDYRQFYFGDIHISLNSVEFFVDELMGYIKPIVGINKKCIVLDLDNTLWGGIVGEDGFEGIDLSPNGKGASFMEFQQRLLALQQRGIILAINSKNNLDDALKVIEEHPFMVLRKKNFACIRINWNDKVSNMKEIAQELNIGLDSIAFFDDDKINCEFMKHSLPQILTVELPKDPSNYSNLLTSLNDFNVLKITTEDIHRGEMYIQQKNRSELKKTTDLESFLKQLHTKVTIERANEFTIPRISQLTLKTNQFNLWWTYNALKYFLNFALIFNLKNYL